MLSGRRPDPLGWQPRNYGTMEMTSAPSFLAPPAASTASCRETLACLAALPATYDVATSPGSASASGVGVNEAG